MRLNFDKPLLAILALVILVRLAVVLPFQNIPRPGDEGDFLLKASIMVSDFKDAAQADNWRLAVFKALYWQGSSKRAPLYPYFIGLQILLFGDCFHLVVLLYQILFSCITALILYFIARHIYGRRTALFSMAIFAFYPTHVFYTSYYMAEVFFTTLFWSSILFLIIFYASSENREGIKNNPALDLLYSSDQTSSSSFNHKPLNQAQRPFLFLWLAGFFLGLAALCKPFALYALPFFALWLFIYHPQSPSKKIKYISILLVSMLLAILPWTIRNYFVLHKFVLLETKTGLQLYAGNTNHPYAMVEDQLFIDFPNNLNEKELGEVEYDKRIKQLAIKNICTHLPLFFKRKIWQVPTLMGLECHIVRRFLQGHYGHVGILGLWLVALLEWGSFTTVTLIGLAGLIFAPHKCFKMLFLFIILFFILVYTISIPDQRYHFPLMLVFFIYSGWILGHRKSQKNLPALDKVQNSKRSCKLARKLMFIILSLMLLIAWYSQITIIAVTHRFVIISKNPNAEPFYQQLCYIARAPQLWPELDKLLVPY